MDRHVDTLKSFFKHIVCIAAAYAFLTSLDSALTIYVGGTGLGMSAGATGGLSILQFILGWALATFVYTFIMSIATVIGAVFYGVFSGNFLGKNHSAPQQSAEVVAAEMKLLKYGVIADLIVSALTAAYGALGKYAILSAVSAKTGLITLIAVLTFVETFIMAMIVFAFIGTVALVIAGVLYSVFSSNRAA